jgi:predicted amino acid-binding ACT domain protein
MILPIKYNLLSSSQGIDAGLNKIVTAILAQLNTTNISQAVWGYSTKALTVSPPTAVEIGTQVRTELTTELDRIDVDISSRLATAGYTAPDNTKIDELHKLQGLSAGNPMTVTPTSRTVTGISLAITGDGTTSTTVTRGTS